MPLRIAIDTGGTFTDLVAFDAASGRLLFHKVASTPDDPARAIVAGTQEIAQRAGASLDAIELLVHGTTVATNTVLQRAGARVALLTTAGFRDVLHIQRQDRPAMYDLRSRRAVPLVPRRWRLEVSERMTFDGSVRTPVDAAQLESLMNVLERNQVEAVAVGLLHSYANPAHETLVGDALQKRLPKVSVSLSHELVGAHGEYERFSTCAMNAYVQPVIQHYLAQLETGLKKHGIDAPLFVMKSNGGVMSAAAAGRQCVETVLSGPAGGVVAGAAIARQGKDARRNVITADMGGTSFDVAVIHEGRIAFARDAHMGGLALAVPMLDLHTVGAGGGSVGWIDAGGSLRVGPRSAGAAPGPACYGRGGAEPTVTDANLVLGRLGASSLLGGDMQVDLEAARKAVHDRLAAPLKLSIEQAAEGMVRVVNTTMTAAMRKLTVERGHDPRQFVLCPFGGAGPLHGAELAAELGAAETLVPIAPGVNSAIGLLMSNLREDRIRTHVAPLQDTPPRALKQLFDELRQDAERRLAVTSAGRRLTVARTLGLRYLGQGYELPIKAPDGPLDCSKLADDFHAEHERMYGYARPDQTVEISTVWLSVQVELKPVTLPVQDASSTDPNPTTSRRAVFRGEAQNTAVYQRDDLAPGTTLVGPAIVEQLDSTTLLWPRQRLEVDRYGQLVLGTLAARRQEPQMHTDRSRANH